MELSQDQIQKIDVKDDRILVKQLEAPTKVGRFYIPENARANQQKRRKGLWDAEVVKFGDQVDFDAWNGVEVEVGDVVVVDAVAKDCPSIDVFVGDETVVKYLFVRDDDLAGLRTR